MAFEIIAIVFRVYLILLFIRIFGSWFPNYQRHPLMLFVNFYTDPYLNIFRKVIPPIGMLDISPIVAIYCLGYIENLTKMFIGLFIS